MNGARSPREKYWKCRAHVGNDDVRSRKPFTSGTTARPRALPRPLVGWFSRPSDSAGAHSSGESCWPTAAEFSSKRDSRCVDAVSEVRDTRKPIRILLRSLHEQRSTKGFCPLIGQRVLTCNDVWTRHVDVSSQSWLESPGSCGMKFSRSKFVLN